MARKTQRELTEERNAQIAAAYAELQVNWLPDLFTLMADATEEGMDVKVLHDRVEFSWLDKWNDRVEVDVPMFPSNVFAEDYVDSVRIGLAQIEMRREETNRRYKLRQSALSKLTDEEKEVLTVLK